MAKKTVVTQAWVKVIGETVTKRLSALYGRDFIYHQAGPYTSKLIGIVFNESTLLKINKTVSKDRADFRFGFAVWREYVADHREWWMSAGFLVASKAIAREIFLPNLSERPKEIANKLRDWLEAHKGDEIYLNFEQRENAEFIWEGPAHDVDLELELKKYGDFDRKSKYSQRPAIVVGTRFNAGRWLPELDGVGEDELIDSAESVSATLLGVFEGVGFLYELLQPRGVAPAERSDDQVNFNPDDLEEARQRIASSVASRQGQGEFRRIVLRAYKNRCAVTGCDVEYVLQAAHLFPHTGPRSNFCSNGILLRADIHDLFDRNFLCIDLILNIIRISNVLKKTAYTDLDGLRPHLPDNPAESPHPKALQYRFDEFNKYEFNKFGWPETANTSKVSVRLPRSQQFTVDQLCGLMERVSREEPL
jgi:hypothetical protein